MSQKMIALALVLGVAVHVARAERTIFIDVNFNGGIVTEGTFIIETQELGQPAITPVFTTWIEASDNDPGMQAPFLVRDRMIPEEGIAGAAKRSVFGPDPGVRVFHPDNVQFWASADDGNTWQLITPGGLTGVNQGTTQVVFEELGTNENMPLLAGGSGAVPAVSSWGVAIMALLILGAGCVAFRRRVA